jgi:hypothetical protein
MSVVKPSNPIVPLRSWSYQKTQCMYVEHSWLKLTNISINILTVSRSNPDSNQDRSHIIEYLLTRPVTCKDDHWDHFGANRVYLPLTRAACNSVRDIWPDRSVSTVENQCNNSAWREFKKPEPDGWRWPYPWLCWDPMYPTGGGGLWEWEWEWTCLEWLPVEFLWWWDERWELGWYMMGGVSFERGSKAF